MRRRVLILCAWGLLSSLIIPRCGDAGEPGENKWGPFRGQIIDVDTGQPIPGAVALVVWLKNVPGPVEGHQRFYDASVAGADGQFEVPRRPRPFFNLGIDPPRIDYFAPGYVLAEPLTEATPSVIGLRKWGMATPDQRRMYEITSGIQVWIPDERIVELKDHVNAERRQMGLRPIYMLSGGLPQ